MGHRAARHRPDAAGDRGRRGRGKTALGTTPSATVGPYLAIGLAWEDGADAVAPGTPGAIWLPGTVYDGNGDPVTDALVETWQADPDGRFDHPDDPRGAAAYPGFRGFGRSQSVDGGRYAIRTLKPGRVPDGNGRLQPSHVDVSVFARGLLDRVVSRIYFPDEVEANAADPLLSSLPPERAATLVAEQVGPAELRWDVRLRGEGETVFFAV